MRHILCTSTRAWVQCISLNPIIGIYLCLYDSCHCVPATDCLSSCTIVVVDTTTLLQSIRQKGTGVERPSGN